MMHSKFKTIGCILKQLLQMELPLVILATCLFITNTTKAQQALPTAYPAGTQVNFVRTWDAQAPEQDAAALISRPLKDVKQTTQYLDGLGRPIQTVLKQGSLATATSTSADMISAVTYDNFGREQFKYLPFAATATDGTKTDGSFKLNPFQQQSGFYNTQLAGQTTEINVGANSLNYAYAQTVFEPSPLNRVQESFAPGVSWVGTSGGATEASRKSIKVKYYFNTDLDNVRIWTVTNGAALGSFGSYSNSSATAGMYIASTLTKSITADENNNQVIEFKDKQGKVILKKVQLSTDSGTADDGTGRGYTGWLCTYYIYDDLDQLRCVIQPAGVNLVSATWVLTDATILAEQCFRYEYDARKRMIMKKVPGAGEVYMVYDALDRLVMTQDANMRLAANNKWMVTLYDGLNRPMQTGLLLNTFNNKSFTDHLTAAYTSTGYPFTVASIPAATYWEQLTQTFFDDYSWLAAEGNPVSMNRSTGNDNYFVNIPSTKYPEPYVQSFQNKGMVTGTKTKVIGTTQYLYTGIYYDAKGRVLGTYAQTLSNNIIVTNNVYNFSGQLLCIAQTTSKNGQGIAIATSFDYDDLGRLLTTKKGIWTTYGFNVDEKIIVSNQYDALGQLVNKKIGNNPVTPAKPLAQTNYEYNIRGWLLSLNKAYVDKGKDLSNTNTTDQYFGLELGYDKSGTLGAFTPQYNGNIGGSIWKSEGDQEKRKYDFTYDAVNRLTGADFNQYASGAGSSALFDKTALVDFSVGNLGYDVNGNILTMQQTGVKGNVSSLVDDMTYTYVPNTNRLQNVRDATTAAPLSKLGDFRTSTLHPQNSDKLNATTPALLAAITDYGYDNNGNLTKDYNKDIATPAGGDGIQYNYLNLPSVITIKKDNSTAVKGTISYTYDAGGNKLRKTTVEIVSATNSITTVTDYTGGAIYESKSNTIAATTDYANKLQFLSTEVGRARALYSNALTPAVVTGFAYDYFMNDHLGNVRMVLTEEQQVDIYPAATLETNLVGTENTFYNIDASKIVASSVATGIPAYINKNGIANNNPSCTGTLCTTDNSQYVYQLNSNQNKTGLGITLKVMAGDKIDIFGKSYYFQNNAGGAPANKAVDPLADLLAGFLGGPLGGGVTGAHGAVTAAQLNTPSGIAGINSMLNNQTTQSNTAPTVPKAYVNYIFFDEQFKAVGSGFSQVNQTGSLKDHHDDPNMQNINVPKNGFVYIYCSNESPVNVFFDNIQVTQTRSPILEETHYYPFGLTMAGISSKAAGKLENKYKFNDGSELANKEFSDGSGLELYETDFRSYDPQIGRFHQIDPLADYAEYNSPYTFASNNPISFNDPTGLKDSTHKEVSTPNNPTILQPVIIFSPVKIKAKQDNTHVAITIPSLTTPAPMGQGGLELRGEGGGDSPATPSNGGDHESVEISLLLTTFGFADHLEPLHPPEIFNPRYYIDRAYQYAEYQAAKKESEEKDKYKNATPGPTSGVDKKGFMIWLYPRMKRFDTTGKSKFIHRYKDSSTYFNPGEGSSNSGDKPDTGKVITFPTKQ